MSNSGPGADPRGSSEWDNPSWSSSLSESSLSSPDEEPPNPWSREGSLGSEPAAAGPVSASSANPPADPYRASADPYTDPAGYARPYPPFTSASSAPPQVDRPDPGFDPQPIPPYGTPGTSYGSPAPAYADPPPVYGAPPPAYGSNPYEVSPYQPVYGSSIPYGVVPVSHPQSTSALIFGILGIVLGVSCGIGGLLGIGGIVLGRKARDEIDAQPGRYSGRSQASAGIVTGVIGVVIAIVVVIIFAAIIVTAFAAE